MNRVLSRRLNVSVRSGVERASNVDHNLPPAWIALSRQDDVDDARVTKNETLVRRGKQR